MDGCVGWMDGCEQPFASQVLGVSSAKNIEMQGKTYQFELGCRVIHTKFMLKHRFCELIFLLLARIVAENTIG